MEEAFIYIIHKPIDFYIDFSYRLKILVTPLLHFFHEFITSNFHVTKEVAFADDFTVSGKISAIKEYMGPKYGYFPKAAKSHLIVKQQYEQKANDVFAQSNVNITTSGKRHLGAVIGSESYKKEYVSDLVNDWKKQLETLSMMAEIEPQSAYAAFVFGFRSKLAYFMRTIPDLNNLLVPIEETIRFRFILALTGGHHCSDLERKLLSLPVRFGGLGITNFVNVSCLEYDNSRKITKSLSYSIIKQKLKYNEDTDDLHKIKVISNIINKNDSKPSEQQKRINNINQEKGVSN